MKHALADALSIRLEIGEIVKPLKFVRDREAYAAWWAELDKDQRDMLAEQIADIIEPSESEFALQRLTSDVFQEFDGAAWLRVEGLRAGVQTSYLVLDIEPAYDGEGMRDGSTVVASLHLDLPEGGMTFLTVPVYVSKPWREFAPESSDLEVQVAEIVDYALALVNAELVDRDKFNKDAREV